MRMKKMLPLLFVFGLLFIGCDLVYENEINETETSAGKEGSGGGTTGGETTKTLSENKWATGEFSKDGQIDTYYISVIKGNQYLIAMRNAYSGEKTAYTGLKISHSDGTIICSSYDKNPYVFTAPSTGTVTITVASCGSYYGSWEQGTGTYSIGYENVTKICLAENEWKDGYFSKNEQTDVYFISVTKGIRYSIYTNNEYDGYGKTAKTGLKILYLDGTIICSSYDKATKLYETPYTFTAPSTGTVMITVASYDYIWGYGIGSYAIKYTEGN